MTQFIDKLDRTPKGWEGKCCCGYTTNEPHNEFVGLMTYAFCMLKIHVESCKQHAKEDAAWQRKRDACNTV